METATKGDEEYVTSDYIIEPDSPDKGRPYRHKTDMLLIRKIVIGAEEKNESE